MRRLSAIAFVVVSSLAGLLLLAGRWLCRGFPELVGSSLPRASNVLVIGLIDRAPRGGLTAACDRQLDDANARLGDLPGASS
jgi:hypothetical protein